MDTITAAAPPPDSALPAPTPDPARPDAPQLRTLLLTDLVDSTMLVERLGDGPAAELFRAHDRIVLRLQEQWRGRLIDRSDGLLLLFERPIDGLGFALDYARGLRDLGVARGIDLKARAGLHVGEVLTWRNSDEAVRVGAKPLEVEGLAKPMAGRLMSMARPGQILLSAIAEPLAHRAARELGQRGEMLLWKAHGRWRFKGVPQAQDIFEVGEAGIAPLRSPLSSNKVWRDVPLWRRPAALAAEVTVLAIVAVGAWFALKPQPAIAFGERDWVVVGDLRNLTGQPVLDESLEQAFRISLEQSRYVNVLSDLKARDTLARMRKPADTQIDRAIASEIAIRDGARAVILPTVSEVGGRVRVSAEVIDPTTQATVHAASHDGTGMRSALDSIDAVTHEMRENLGEAVAAIDRDSQPLPRVTTSNLDALRAYSVGTGAYSQRRFDDALRSFERAVALDPEFALAHLGVMRVFISNADNARALTHLRQAQRWRSHLTSRDALYLDAWAAELGPNPTLDALPKWKTLADNYPDYYAGHAQIAFGQFSQGRYDTALRHVRAYDTQQNPLRDTAIELTGRIHMARGNPAEALQAFRRAEQAGGYGPTRRSASALAAMERFADARALLRGRSSTTVPSGRLLDNIEAISIEVDAGRSAEAARLASRVASQASGENPLVRYPFAINALLLSTERRGTARNAARLAAQITDDASKPDAADRVDLLPMALAAITVAQRAGDETVAPRLLKALRPMAEAGKEPMTLALLSAVDARQALLEKDFAKAESALGPERHPSRPYQWSVVRRDILQAKGEVQEASVLDAWLVRHRGLAYIEPIGGQVFQTMNVMDARRAAQRRGLN